MKNKVALACLKCQTRNYTISKSKSAQTKRMEMRKYCKVCDAHELHRETK